MIIKFKSESIQDDKPRQIEFTTEAMYEIFVDDESDEKYHYHTYHFKEPKNNESNRIEINEKRVNIFAGPTTLMMIKDQKTPNSFVKVDGKEFTLLPELHSVNITDKAKIFEYSLYSANEDLIGKFKVTIENQE